MPSNEQLKNVDLHLVDVQSSYRCRRRVMRVRDEPSLTAISYDVATPRYPSLISCYNTLVLRHRMSVR